MLKQAMEFADQIVDPVNFESETLEEIGVQLKDFKTNLEKNSGKVGIAIEIIAQELLRRHYGMKVGDVIASVNRNGTVREFFFQRFELYGWSSLVLAMEDKDRPGAMGFRKRKDGTKGVDLVRVWSWIKPEKK